MSPPFASPHLSPLAFIPRVLLDLLGPWEALQPVLTLQRFLTVPIISSCNLKVNGEVPFGVPISNHFSPFGGGGFVLCSMPTLNLERKRGQSKL